MDLHTQEHQEMQQAEQPVVTLFPAMSPEQLLQLPSLTLPFHKLVLALGM